MIGEVGKQCYGNRRPLVAMQKVTFSLGSLREEVEKTVTSSSQQ